MALRLICISIKLNKNYFTKKGMEILTNVITSKMKN